MTKIFRSALAGMALGLGAGMVLLMLLLITAPPVDELKAENDKYCEMVAIGAWGDYKGTYEKHCKGK